MRLKRLTISDWRVIETLAIDFSDAVTVIEGPNEAGKSTLVEALGMLFDKLDSSTAADVRAVKPMGRDVGSTVEAELEIGDHHLVYAKTYNRDKKTTLTIRAPRAEKLTGREAHDRFTEILQSHVDMGLFRALLIPQGAAVAQVSLRESGSLSKALDAAAGAGTGGDEDGDLLAAVQAEYENYFSLKKGSPKYLAGKSELDDAAAALQTAQTALEEVAEDAAAHARFATEQRRLAGALPALRAGLSEREKAVGSVRALQADVAARRRDRDVAVRLRDAAQQALAQRRGLIAEAERSAQRLAEVQSQNTGLTQRATRLRDMNEQAQEAARQAGLKLKQCQRAALQAQSDLDHLRDLRQLDEARQRVGQLERLATALRENAVSLQSVRVDDAALQSLREAQHELIGAEARRDGAATTVKLRAHRALTLEIDGEPVDLADGASATRQVAAELALTVPGVVTARVAPSADASDLQKEVDACRQTLQARLERCGEPDLSAAIAANARLNDARRAREHLQRRERELLGAATRDGIAHELQGLADRCSHYAAERDADAALPADVVAADGALRNARAALDVAEGDNEERRVLAGKRVAAATEAEARRRVQEQELEGLARVVEDKRAQLKTARIEASDAALEKHGLDEQTRLEQALQAVKTLETALASASPDTLEALRDNAVASLERAQRDLSAAEQQLAIREDRLDKARGQGRYETADSLRRRHAAAKEEWQRTERRAGAARRLWTTLNQFRDAARRAYVGPLRDSIERLGAVVFGADFRIELNDDWHIASRTLAGLTVSFQDLSVGAQEQLGMLMRLAAARIVADDGGVPLIIDDELGFSDPARLETMGAAIASAGRDSQIVVLTCSPGRFTHIGNATTIEI